MQSFNCLFISVLSFEVQLSEGWNPLNRFNPAICLCLSQLMSWISNSTCRGHSCVDLFEVRGGLYVFADISGIVDQHCFNIKKRRYLI